MRSEKMNVEAANLHLKPLIMAYRPLHPSFGAFPVGGYRISAVRPTLRGTRMLVLEPTQGGKRVNGWSLWVDTERECVIGRFALGNETWTEIQIDVEYDKHPKWGWLVRGWSGSWVDRQGNLVKSFRADLVSREINASIHSDAFALVFPSGTVVADTNQPSELGSTRFSVVKDDGTERPILAADLGASYEQLLASEPGMAHHAGSSPGRWVGYSIVILVIGLLGIASYRLRRRRTAPSS
jgi:hypothetical protein